MKSLFKKIRDAFASGQNPTPPAPDIEQIISQIRGQEDSGSPGRGRRIHRIAYSDLDICLDVDITNTYRITVDRGKERIYSFSVYCDRGAYDQLEQAYERIFTFLNGERRLNQLPDDDLLKGFYYGE